MTDSPPPRTGAAEKDVLLGFLDYLRSCVIGKIRGTSEPQVRTPGVESGTNLLGLVKHLGFVERFTFLGETVSDWPSTFHAGKADTVESVVQVYQAAIAAANHVIAGCADLEAPAARPSRGKKPPSMRWALVHMIEETGRHAGQMDILRELIDGTTGR